MRVIAPPAKLREQSVGGVDGARTLGPSGARERVKPLKLGYRRGELSYGPQAA